MTLPTSYDEKTTGEKQHKTIPLNPLPSLLPVPQAVVLLILDAINQS